MTRFEAYLIRSKMELRKLGYEEVFEIVDMIHEQYIKKRKEPDLTEEERLSLQREFKEYVYERLANRSGSKS